MHAFQAQWVEWRRRDFLGGGNAGSLKLYHGPGRLSGGAGFRWVAKFHFLKRCKVLEKESIFQRYQHVFLPKLPFSRKNFENSRAWHGFFRGGGKTSKSLKDLLRKPEIKLFSIFLLKIERAIRYIFALVDEKRKILEILRKLSKIFKLFS